MSELTPIEFLDGDYANRDDVVVWYGCYVVAEVSLEPGHARIYTYDDHCVGYPNKDTACLTVEPRDIDNLRQQIKVIADQLPVKGVVALLENAKCELAWRQELAERE